MWSEFPDTLPASLDELMPLGANSDAQPRMQPSLLLVDDDSFLLGMQSRMLRDMGYPMIGTAGSAEAALARLHKDPRAVDVIICDLNMPGMDGIEFLQILAASAYRGSVILLSGEDLRIMHTVQKLLGDRLVILGAIEKPAGRAALNALLNRWSSATVPTPSAVTPVFTPDEVHAANAQRQWVLHYQPKVDLTTGAWVGSEALVRWAHPVHGLVFPDHFIDTAENCGAIDALTDWVLQEAVDQQARWRAAAGYQVHIAVNISMENLGSPDFVRRAGRLLSNSCSSPLDLTLELTESRLITSSAVPLESLARLRMQRFGLSIDDFGTGHSSLAQLRDVPFTELKIDRGFVHGARHNQIIRPILESSIGIAKRLGMQSVAEGVETEDDWQLLREIGCDVAQGYFIGRPVPPEHIPAWLYQWQLRRARLVES